MAIVLQNHVVFKQDLKRHVSVQEIKNLRNTLHIYVNLWCFIILIIVLNNRLLNSAENGSSKGSCFSGKMQLQL
jgi:hypothetical protein